MRRKKSTAPQICFGFAAGFHGGWHGNEWPFWSEVKALHSARNGSVFASHPQRAPAGLLGQNPLANQTGGWYDYYIYDAVGAANA
jgi:hypothetical protein